MDTPYQWTKQVASHWGGTRNGTIVRFPKLIKDKGGIRNQFAPRHRHRADDPRGAGLPEPTFVHGVQQSPTRARACSTASTMPTPPNATTSSTSRCSATAASTTRAGARSPSTDAVAHGRRTKPCVRRRRLGALRRQHGLDAGPRPVQGDAGQAARAAAAMADRGHALQRVAARRPGHRAGRCRDRRPTDTDPGRLAAPVRRDGPVVREQCRQHQEQVVLGDRRTSRSRRAARRARSSPRAGGSAAGLSTRGTARPSSSTTSSASTSSRSSATDPIPPASTRCGWSSPTTAAASARAAP